MTGVERLLAALMSAQAGGSLAQPPGVDGSPGLGIAALTGSSRPREWDYFVTAHAPDLTGETLTFFALEDGSLVVYEDVPDGSAIPVAEALEQVLKPPYQAAAARHEGEVWCAIAEPVQLLELPAITGDEIEVTDVEGRHELRVDGVLTAPIPEQLLAIVRTEGDSALIGERLDGNLFAFKVWVL